MERPDDLEGMPEESLVEKFQTTGEMKYFAELWRRYAGPAYGRLLRLLGDRAAAEDVTSDTFLRAMEGLRTGKYQRGNFAGWLFTIARHLGLNWRLSAAERYRGGGDRDGPAPPRDPEMRAQVESVLNQLADEQRIALKLLYIERLTFKEIAVHQGWTMKQVKTHVQNGRRMFLQVWTGRSSRTRGAGV